MSSLVRFKAVSFVSLDGFLYVLEPLQSILTPMELVAWFSRSSDHPIGANRRCVNTAPKQRRPCAGRDFKIQFKYKHRGVVPVPLHPNFKIPSTFALDSKVVGQCSCFQTHDPTLRAILFSGHA